MLEKVGRGLVWHNECNRTLNKYPFLSSHNYFKNVCKNFVGFTSLGELSYMGSGKPFLYNVRKNCPDLSADLGT